MVLLDQLALTPDGKPVAVPIPVAIVVVCVILVIAVFCVTVGVEDAEPAPQDAQETTGQFSNAAFFQRTLISSKYKSLL